MALVEFPVADDDGCGGGVEFALGSAFSSCSLCSAAAAADDAAVELEEPFPAAVVVVWGTYYNFPAMSTMISTATFTFRIRKVLGYMVRTWLREQRAPERGIMRPSIHHLAGDRRYLLQ